MTKLSIPDMSCGHCRASITEALGKIEGVGAITFDPENRTAEVSGTVSTATLIVALDEIGFPATVAP